MVDRVVQTGTLNTTKDVIERAVLEENPDDVLDFVFEIRNGCLGTGFVSKRRRAGREVARGVVSEQGGVIEYGGRSSQEAEEGPVGLHRRGLGGKREPRVEVRLLCSRCAL
jgi:hypothetical protein